RVAAAIDEVDVGTEHSRRPRRHEDGVPRHLRELLDTCGYVHGVPDHRVLELASSADRAGDDRPCVEPDTDPEVIAELGTNRGLDVERGGDGPVRMAVDRIRAAEDCEEPVAQEGVRVT